MIEFKGEFSKTCKEFVLKLGGNIRAYNENGLVIEFNLPL